jgi:hypothetical protein
MKILGLDHVGIVVRVTSTKPSLGRATPLTAELSAGEFPPAASICKYSSSVKRAWN